MPFDLLGGQTVKSLTDHLTSIGIAPVPMATLKAHKAEQVRRHPANLLITYKPYAAIGVAVMLALGSPALLEGNFDLLPVVGMAGIAAFGTSFLLIAGFCDLCNIRLRGRAIWFEDDIYRNAPLPDMPPVIRKVVEDVRRFSPRVQVRYGQLIQRSELIDPYIVVECGDERACLGIWEDDRVVAVATDINE